MLSHFQHSAHKDAQVLGLGVCAAGHQQHNAPDQLHAQAAGISNPAAGLITEVKHFARQHWHAGLQAVRAEGQLP